MFDWIKQKLIRLPEFAEARLIITHPLRTFLFMCLVAPILFPLSLGGLLAGIGLVIMPLFSVTKIWELEPISALSILKLLLIWVMGIVISSTSFYMATAGILLYCSEIYYTIVLLFKGKSTRGEIIKVWNTQTRSGNSTTHSTHCTIQYYVEEIDKEIIQSGFSQRSLLQKILESELELGKIVSIVYHPKNFSMARVIHD
ncbi:MAG: hypothetical protein SFU98_20540 [Leptospiraceae bacterium]|nr:hypothetical protein [Leptospiraceae bacterium]